MDNENQPLVSIGIPVYNGEEGLACALDTVINQDYSNLEIIISDNASTDSTPKICEKFARQDSRIKYFRSEVNPGSSWNFNRVFELSTGKYFTWAAHDDQREESMIRECTSRMEKFPDAVLCQVHVAQYIVGREELLCIAHMDSVEGETELVTRYRKILQNPPMLAVCGLIRSSSMRKTALMKKALGGDLLLLQELSFHGSFVQVPKTLFTYFGREKWNTISQDYFVFHGKGKKPWWYLPFFVLFLNQCSRVTNSDFPFSIKVRLWSVLIIHEIRQGVFKIFMKIFGVTCPERWKIKWGCAIYWRWMHSPDLQVGSEELFLERVIKPRLGWWR